MTREDMIAEAVLGYLGPKPCLPAVLSILEDDNKKAWVAEMGIFEGIRAEFREVAEREKQADLERQYQEWKRAKEAARMDRRAKEYCERF